MTPLNARLSSSPQTVAALAARTMVGRNGLAEDFAGAAVFLASRASAYLTGQAIFIDGGLSVHRPQLRVLRETNLEPAIQKRSKPRSWICH